MLRLFSIPLLLAMFIATSGCAEPPKPAPAKKPAGDDKKAASTDDADDKADDATANDATSDDTTSDDSTSDDAAADVAVDENWGTLRGRFVYDGAPPEPRKLDVNKDIEVCTKHHPVDQSLLVGEGGGLQNVVVFTREEELEVHPEYEGSTDKPVTLDNHFCAFEPHVFTLQTGQKLVIKNTDDAAHNTNMTEFFNNEGFNELIPPGEALEKSFENPESFPVGAACNIHPWMKAYVILRDNPYMAVSGKDGAFEIKNLPVGEHEFQFWQEKRAGLAAIEIGDQTTDKRGRATITIEPGMNDLGDITIAPEDLER